MGVEAVNALVNLIAPKSSTQTTSSNISKEGMDALLQQILSGTQGLAAVASGQKSAGLYGSTTTQMLTNDLLTRATGELAKQKAGTTTTTKVAAPLGKLGGALPFLMAGNALAKTGIGKKATSMVGADANAIIESLTGASGVSAGSLIAANATADPLGTLIASQGWTAPVAASGSAVTSGAAGAGSALAGTSGALLADGTIAGAADVGGMLAAANATADPLGAFIGSLGYDAAAATAAGAGIADAGLGAAAAAGEGVGLGETLLALAAWVICTELHAQGKLSTKLYKASGERALTLSPEVMAGYHVWAIPFTKLLRKSDFLSRLIAPIAISRCEYLLGEKRIWGWLTVHVGERVCGWIGKRLTRKTDWRVLYG